MLSILIPVYNYDVRELVSDLVQQAEGLSISVEILCFDDGSEKHFKLINQLIQDLPIVTYRELPQNLGRSRIRNLLGETAQFDHLLFMDCDSGVLDSSFLENYIQQLPYQGVICGGRQYQKAKPSNDVYFFHWKYGRAREVRTAASRNQDPYHGFMSNNFLVDKSIFLEVQFDPELLQYGHEDTLFGWELSKRQIPIMHIDNPLFHLGLESKEIFLRKTAQGIQNLIILKNKYPELSTTLTQKVDQLDRWMLSGIIKIFSPLLFTIIKKRLSQNDPSITTFNIYKLLLFFMGREYIGK